MIDTKFSTAFFSFYAKNTIQYELHDQKIFELNLTLLSY